MLAVGNVGESLVPYTDSDTFLTRDGGFTWQEVHKDAHMWEYGDQGSILILANDEEVTDHVSYTLNEGLTWQDYTFGERIRVRSIVTVPMDTSRKFILFGVYPDKPDSTVAVHLDFSSITNVKCELFSLSRVSLTSPDPLTGAGNLDLANPNNDDFELWSPSEEREEQCLFGVQVSGSSFVVLINVADLVFRQALYHRRIRDRNCYIGERLPQPHKIEKNCPCTEEDFEWCVSAFHPMSLCTHKLVSFTASSTTSATREAFVSSSTAPRPSNRTRRAPGTSSSGTSGPTCARSLTPSALAASPSTEATPTPAQATRVMDGSFGLP